MYEWIVEADLHRLREARRAAESNQERQCLDGLIAAMIRKVPARSPWTAMQESEQSTWSYKQT